MGEAKRRREYLSQHPEIQPEIRQAREPAYDDGGTQVVVPKGSGRIRGAMRFTEQLASELRNRRPAPPKPSKDMTEEERKAATTERNRRRRRDRLETKRSEAVAQGLANKPPTENTCRRRRLAAKRREQK